MSKAKAQEKRVTQLLARDTLPSTFTKGAQRAYKNFQSFYGPDDGKRIFIKKALEQGHGKTVDEKINSIYHVGATL